MLKSVLILLLAMASIQTGASLAKGLFPVLGAAGTSALRLLFATLILWIVFRPWRHPFTRQQIGKLFLYGASLGFMNLLFYFALERIPLGIAVALEFTGPLVIAVLGSKRKTDYLWALLAAVGIFLLLPDVKTGGLDPVGILFALGAGFFWGTYIFFGRRVSLELPGSVAASGGMAVAALVVVPWGFATGGSQFLDSSIIPLGLAVAFLSSALPYSLEMISLKNIPMRTFGVLMSLEPAIGALAGLFILREALTMPQWLAIACVVVSSLGSTLAANNNPLET